MLGTRTIADLDREMAARNLGGHWQLSMGRAGPEPRTIVEPCLWRWRDIDDALTQAGELIGLDMTDRRTVRLINPALRDRQATTHTLQLSVQLVRAGEVATCHRHTIAAIRYVVRGAGAFTTVQGQQCRMAPGDLVLTPAMTWHDHTNDTDEPIVWLDGLDVPLVQSLQQVVMQPYESDTQPIAHNSETNGQLHGVYRPRGMPTPGGNPYFHYRWADAERALAALAASAAPDPYDAHYLDYANPTTGGPTLPTMACALTLLPAGHETRAHRHTSTVIYHAFRGSGTTYVGDERFDWGPGDTFVVPLWYPHRHANLSGAEAVLFSMSDAPVLQALGLQREEAV